MTALAVCPECRNGKHPNCDQWAIDENDELGACACSCRASVEVPADSATYGLTQTYWLTPEGCAAAGGHTTHDQTCRVCIACGARVDAPDANTTHERPTP